MGNGLCETLVQLKETDKSAKGNGELNAKNRRVSKCKSRPNDSYQHVRQTSQTTIDGHHDICNLIGIACAGTQLLVDCLKIAYSLLLMTEYFNNLLPCHHFLDKAIDLCQTLLLDAEVATRPFAQLCRRNHHDNSHHDAYQSQWNAKHDH